MNWWQGAGPRRMPHTNNANFNAKRKREAEAGKQKKPAAAAGGGGDKRVHRHAVYQQRAAQKHRCARQPFSRSGLLGHAADCGRRCRAVARCCGR